MIYAAACIIVALTVILTSPIWLVAVYYAGRYLAPPVIAVSGLCIALADWAPSDRWIHLAGLAACGIGIALTIYAWIPDDNTAGK